MRIVWFYVFALPVFFYQPHTLSAPYSALGKLAYAASLLYPKITDIKDLIRDYKPYSSDLFYDNDPNLFSKEVQRRFPSKKVRDIVHGIVGDNTITVLKHIDSFRNHSHSGFGAGVNKILIPLPVSIILDTGVHFEFSLENPITSIDSNEDLRSTYEYWREGEKTRFFDVNTLKKTNPNIDIQQLYLLNDLLFASSLTPDEIKGSLMHEYNHIRFKDTTKSVLGCTLFGVGFGLVTAAILDKITPTYLMPKIIMYGILSLGYSKIIEPLFDSYTQRPREKRADTHMNIDALKGNLSFFKKLDILQEKGFLPPLTPFQVLYDEHPTTKDRIIYLKEEIKKREQ